MITSQPMLRLAEIALDERVLRTIEIVLVQYREWKTLQSSIHAQIAFDFHLDHSEQTQIGETLQQIHVFADALRMIADQIEKEVEDTTDRYYTWLGD